MSCDVYYTDGRRYASGDTTLAMSKAAPTRYFETTGTETTSIADILHLQYVLRRGGPPAVPLSHYGGSHCVKYTKIYWEYYEHGTSTSPFNRCLYCVTSSVVSLRIVLIRTAFLYEISRLYMRFDVRF